MSLTIGPGGDLFYVDFNGGTIRRIEYFSSNQPPTAIATANPTSGTVPLQVTFNGTGSSDPDNHLDHVFLGPGWERDLRRCDDRTDDVHVSDPGVHTPLSYA